MGRLEADVSKGLMVDDEQEPVVVMEPFILVVEAFLHAAVLPSGRGLAPAALSLAAIPVVIAQDGALTRRATSRLLCLATAISGVAIPGEPLPGLGAWTEERRSAAGPVELMIGGVTSGRPTAECW